MYPMQVWWKSHKETVFRLSIQHKSWRDSISLCLVLKAVTQSTAPLSSKTKQQHETQHGCESTNLSDVSCWHLKQEITTEEKSSHLDCADARSKASDGIWIRTRTRGGVGLSRRWLGLYLEDKAGWERKHPEASDSQEDLELGRWMESNIRASSSSTYFTGASPSAQVSYRQQWHQGFRLWRKIQMNAVNPFKQATSSYFSLSLLMFSHIWSIIKYLLLC